MSQLTTLANVKQWLNVSANSPDDALLTRMITASSGFIEAWLNRTIAQESYTETRNGKDTDRLVFANYPVSAVASVQVDGIAIPLNTQQPPLSGYLFDSTTLYLYGYLFNRGYQNCIFTYTAGYATTPPEIEQACIELISHRYRERDRIGQKSKTVGGETVSYDTSAMPDSVAELLYNYRKVVPV